MKKILLIGFFSFASSLKADTRFVSLQGNHISPFTSWADAATNIQDAINIAADGDLILITNGNYAVSTPINLSKGVTLLGVNGTQNTFIDGGYPDRTNNCFNVNHTDAILDGLTITNGMALSEGGGMNLSLGKIQNCVISGNHGDFGAIYVSDAGIISNCAIRGNTGRAGGLFIATGSNTARVQFCSISDNVGTTEGGGAHSRGACIFDHCSIFSNLATSADSGRGGGGIHISLNGSNTVIQSSSIHGNFSAGEGGGIRMSAGQIFNSEIFNNNAQKGGGIYSSDQKSLVRNCLIYENKALGNDGGGLYLAIDTLLENCTITRNYSADEAGGLYLLNGGIIVNSIIYHNSSISTASNYFNSGAGESYSNCCAAPLIIGNANVSGDPRFLDNTANFNLATNSSCLDAGTNLAWMANATDLAGVPRIINNYVDIGAYEFIPPELDSDADGIPDSWEFDHSGSLTNIDVTSDTDSDQTTASDEYLAGTDPNDNSSVFETTSVAGNNNLIIRWASVSNRTYSISYISNLINDADIILETNIAGTPPLNSYTDTTGNVSARYYKIKTGLD